MFNIMKKIGRDPIYYGIVAIGRILKGSANMDTWYLKLLYKYKLGKKLDLKNPKTYNEKLQWMKVHYYNPLYTQLADKYAVRQYIADKIGEEYVVENIDIALEKSRKILAAEKQ